MAASESEKQLKQIAHNLEDIARSLQGAGKLLERTLPAIGQQLSTIQLTISAALTEEQREAIIDYVESLPESHPLRRGLD